MRIFTFSVLSFIAALVFAVSPALATDWTVTKTTASVKFTVDKVVWQNVTAGIVLPNKSWVDTGLRGRLLLTRGTDSISLSPGTLAGVFDLGRSLDKTVVDQQSGTMAFDVTRKSAPWMTVKTRMLVAVVKGTQFEVSIKGKKTDVSVSRGIVQVTDTRSGGKADVVAGQSASVGVSGQSGVSVTGTNSTSTKASAAANASSNSANSNAGGNGNGNAGGNGNGNAGGNGNGNAGGNGNGNAGGNGNGNAGGNGNGKGNSSK